MYKGGNELEYRIRNIEAFIYNLMVIPSRRGNGIAGNMLHQLAESLTRKSITNVYLAVSQDNYSAIKAYNKAGFDIVSKKTFVRFLRVNLPYHCL